MANSKKIRTPKKIKVNNVAYKTIYRSEAWSNKHKAVGMCHFDKKLIELSENQANEDLVNTYIHELAHSIFHEYEIRMSRAKEEETVTKLANGLTDVFKNNKNLMHWILNKLS